MRLSQHPPTILSLLAILLTASHPTYAAPYPADDLITELNAILIEPRCAYPCGWSGQVCCQSAGQCYTDASGQAQCGISAAVTSAAVQGSSGQWQYFVSTYVETDLVTVVTTYSSQLIGATQVVVPTTTLYGTTSVAQATTSAAASECNNALNEVACGSICCASGQYCQTPGQCAANGGDSSVNGNSFTTNSVPSQTLSAPLRPTSAGATTVTNTVSPTTTVPFQTPSMTGTSSNSTMPLTVGQSNNGLSGGAIAGIVVGVIAGIILLLLLCACFCLKAGIDGLLSIFGLGKNRRRRQETIVEERYSRHGSGGQGRTWYGGQGPARVDRPPQKQSGGGLGGLGAVAAGLTTLAVILGLKRRHDRDEKSNYSSSYSYSTEYSASSDSSGDRITRGSRRSRR
ncbi:MAG: hypothetical protein M1827_003237 [Pycnora praestabilis]|nr:MAG: hypothetical protein M1827_003237 [Pycnora praestabilis]